MENIRIRDVIVDHLFHDEERNNLPYLRYLGHLSYETFQTVIKAHCKNSHKSFMVVMVTKLEQSKFN